MTKQPKEKKSVYFFIALVVSLFLKRHESSALKSCICEKKDFNFYPENSRKPLKGSWTSQTDEVKHDPRIL